jgi:hypothetical protein
MKCTVHPDKDIKWFCISCGRGLCPDCAIPHESGHYVCNDCFRKNQGSKIQEYASNSLMLVVEQKYYDFFIKGVMKEDSKGKNLSKEKLKLYNHIIDSFPTYYMTLMSILQATALSYLIVSMKGGIIDDLFKGTIDPLNIVMFLNATLVIIEIWYEYMMGALAYRWTPTLLDTLIPFLLGFSEFLLIISIDYKSQLSWYLSMAMVCFVSMFAYYNMYRGSYINYRINKITLESLGNITILNQILIFLSGVTFLAFAAAEWYFNFHSLALLIVSFVMICVFIWRGVVNWKKILF